MPLLFKGGECVKAKTKRVAVTGILAALALAFSFLEGLLPPLPMTPPGFKLGLSNVVSMYAAGSLGLPCALFLAVLKGGFALFTRGFAAGMMSICGALASTVCVWALFKTNAPYAVLGVCGALVHNFAQLCCAFVLTSSAVIFYIPAVALFGVLTGILTGTVLRFALPALEKAEKFFKTD